ncbi:MAG: ISNCY family transposase [Acidobacteriaceae bacterium]
MSVKEENRIEVMGRVKSGSLRLGEGAEICGVSYRQMKRIWARFRDGGAKGMQHRGCGRGSNRGYSEATRSQAVERYREQYGDFGPTLAAEQLGEEGLAVSRQTLARWLRAAGLWSGARRRKPYRERRARREHFGELVQMDGSFHLWLEERGERGCLMHMVDDATSTAEARFYAEETIWAAVGVLRRWIEKYGVPRALYTDWKNVYVREATEAEKLAGQAPLTQFGRMCHRLDIRIIAANSPQAKGRVERAHGTHQDRLVKKLRLAGISDYEAANCYLDQHYLADHNRRYARPAASTVDYHRRRPTARQLEEVFRLEEERVVSADWVVSYKTRLLQLERQSQRYAPARSRVTVGENEQGELTVTYHGRCLRFRQIIARAAPAAAPADKVHRLDTRGGRREGRVGTSRGRPSLQHPWRRPFKPQTATPSQATAQLPPRGHFY